jgi:hypothetical protein
MKPETPAQDINVERLPDNIRQNVDKLSDLDSPEQGNTEGIEAFEKRSELNAAMIDLGSSTALPPQSNSQVTIGSTLVTANPLIANDDDLIEKEWVDKAKKIIAETQNNPYQRDEEVNKLQVDYLKKRFGRELGVTE